MAAVTPNSRSAARDASSTVTAAMSPGLDNRIPRRRPTSGRWRYPPEFHSGGYRQRPDVGRRRGIRLSSPGDIAAVTVLEASRAADLEFGVTAAISHT